MSLDAQQLQALSSVPQLSRLYATYGVEVNALSVEEIFALYERTGFLYPGKAARLRPHLGIVLKNWRKMLKAGESLLYILTAGDETRGMASIAVWRTAPHGWMSQHLVSDNNPFASRAVMLAAAAGKILRGTDDAQNWFRPENRFPARVFGSMVYTIGEALCSVQRHSYFALPRGLKLSATGKIRAVPYEPSQKQALSAIASATRGSVYIAGEDLLGDTELKSVDEMIARWDCAALDRYGWRIRAPAANQLELLSHIAGRWELTSATSRIAVTYCFTPRYPRSMCLQP